MFLKTALRTLALSLVLALPLHSYASEPPESEIEEIVTPGADDDEIEGLREVGHGAIVGARRSFDTQPIAPPRSRPRWPAASCSRSTRPR